MLQISKRVIMAAAILLPALAMPFRGFGQTATEPPRLLSLEEALMKAEQSSYAIRQAHIAWQSATADAHRSRSSFLPQVNLVTTAVTTTDPLNAFGFGLKKQNITSADFDPARLNFPDRTDLFTTRLEIMQPILVPDGIYRGRASRSRMRAAEIGKQLTRHAVVFQVKRAYFGLLLARHQLVVLDSAVVVARTNRDQTRTFYEEGLITRADLLEADVHVLNIEHRRTVAAVGVENASDHIRFLLDIEDLVEIIPTGRLTLVTDSVRRIDIERVNRDRTDMQVLRLQIEAASHMLRASQMAFLPSISAFGSYEWNDNDLFGTGAPNWGAGVSLKWNLFSGYEKVGNLEKARADLRSGRLALEEQAHRNQIDIRETLRSITQSRKRIEVATTAVTQSEENLRIRTNRYAEGVEKTTDVLNAEIMLAEQRLSYLESVYQYNVALFRLEFLLEEPAVVPQSFE